MHYFALLISPERELTPERAPPRWRHTRTSTPRPASAIRAGDALAPSATGVRITGGPDAPTVTDGPFAESAEVAGGYYVFEADNLDEALALARDIPAAKYGAIEVWPMVHFSPARAPADRRQLAGAAAGAARIHRRTRHAGVGRAASRRTRNSARLPATARSAAPRCTRRQRRRRCGCATARCC